MCVLAYQGIFQGEEELYVLNQDVVTTVMVVEIEGNVIHEMK